MEDTHANPLFFHDNPSSFVTIRGDPMGQESRPISSFGYTDPFHARDADEEDGAVWDDRETIICGTTIHEQYGDRPRPSHSPLNHR